MSTKDEGIELVKRVLTSERSLYNFVDRIVRNPVFREKRPNTHAFFKSMNDYRSTRGRLTDRQKIALNSELQKNAPFFVTLRREVVVMNGSSVLRDDVAPIGDDDVASAEADRLASMDSE